MYSPDSPAFVILESEERIADVESALLYNNKHVGGHVIVDVDDYPAAASIVVTIEAVPPVGDPYTILASPSIVAAGRTVLKVYPGLTPVANAAANDIIPSRWRVTVNHADDDAITYSVSTMLVP